MCRRLQSNQKARELGALQCLWTGAMWPRERKWKLGYVDKPDCLACGASCETLSHRWYECPPLVEPSHASTPADLELQESPARKSLLKTRERLRNEAVNTSGPLGNDSVAYAYALPLLPPSSERPDRSPEQCFEWGGEPQHPVGWNSLHR